MNRIKEFIKNFLRSLPLKYIIFESVPDLSDNTRQVYDEFIKRGLHTKYKFVWLVSDSTVIKQKLPNTDFVDFEHDSLKFLYYLLRAKALIYCNHCIEKQNKKTISFYLTHATQIKDSSSYYKAPESVDYCFVTGEAFKKPMANVYHIDERKMLSFGFPRNDVLFRKDITINHLFPGDYKKIIVWYPTFRQSKGGRVVEGCESMPIIHSEEQAVRINEYLKREKMLIVLKPHFAQDVSYLTQLNLSNIILIDDSFFVKNNISSYEFVAGTDSLITDYSSIYFDYLACNKPIAVVWEDIEFYKKNRGFCIDIDYFLKGAEKIYNEEQFISFLRNIAEDNDVLYEARNEIMKLAHDYTDGNNTKRVADFITSLL